MKSNLKTKIALSFLAMSCVSTSFADGQAPLGWNFDKESKFQLGYFRAPDDELKLLTQANGTTKTTPSFQLTKDGFPDGKIPLDLSLQRGFKLPVNGDPKKLTYYLKFYHYPEWLNSHLSASKLSDSFLLSETTRGNELSDFVRSPENVSVKVGYIRSTDEDFSKRPLPSTFTIPGEANASKNGVDSSQSFFDGGLLYFTLYIMPNRELDRSLPEANQTIQSTEGLKALREEIVGLYRKSFGEIKAAKDEKNLIFVRRYPCDSTLNQMCRVSVYKVPTDILFFQNARERPRLQGGKGSYSSGLLVLQQIDYYSHIKKDGNSDDYSFQQIESHWNRGETKILELASVVRFSK